MNLLVVEDNPRDMQELLNLLHGREEQNPTRITTPTRWAMIIKKSPLKTPRFTKEREPGRLWRGTRKIPERQSHFPNFFLGGSLHSVPLAAPFFKYFLIII